MVLEGRERNDQGRKARQYFPSQGITPYRGNKPRSLNGWRARASLQDTLTMSSLDMVAYINATREAGKPELRHDHFMAKVPNVLGYSMSTKFFAHIEIPGPNGGTRKSPVYNFPRREAMLMAMSYSYKLQATVYDAWQAGPGQLGALPAGFPAFAGKAFQFGGGPSVFTSQLDGL